MEIRALYYFITIKKLPFIQYLHSSFITSMENPHQVGEYLFPDTKFEFMKEIGGEHLIKIKFQIAKRLRECILKQNISQLFPCSGNDLTQIGSIDNPR